MNKSLRGVSLIAAIMFAMISARPFLACASASSKIARLMPSILMSICSAVIPFGVPATLKSISP